MREVVKGISDKVLKNVTENIDEILADQGLHNEKEKELNEKFMEFGTRMSRYSSSCAKEGIDPIKSLPIESKEAVLNDIVTDIVKYIKTTKYNIELKEKLSNFMMCVIEKFKTNIDKDNTGSAMFNTCMLHCYEEPMEILYNLQRRIHEISQGDIA